MKNKENKNDGKILGILKLSIISFMVFSLGFIPLVVYGLVILRFISFNEIWHFFLLPFLIYIGIGITLFYQLLISGLFIHIFNYKYKPGLYPYNYRNKMAYNWIVICNLYTPMRKLLEIFPVGTMKYRYYRMLGMKIGKNTLVGGTIMDPCLTEFGDNCTMGLYAVIYGHIHDYEKETILMDKIIIGNNVVIGAGAFIMPGAVIQDDVKIATGAVVTKGQVLEKGKIYAGIPAKEIDIKKKKK
jgi:acetyltransferase-like isoleucine patch superfamily enzyme